MVTVFELFYNGQTDRQTDSGSVYTQKQQFSIGILPAIGISISMADWSTTCNCGASINDSGYDLLTCKTGGGPVWSHECLASVWSDCFRELRIHHRREPRNRYTNSDNRPNIVFFTLIQITILIYMFLWLTHGVLTFTPSPRWLMEPWQHGEMRRKRRNILLPGGSTAIAICSIYIQQLVLC